MKKHRLITGLAWLGILLIGLSGCDTYKRQNKSVKGGIIGGAAGGTAGALVGRAFGNTALGAIIGGAVGGAGGALIGKRMDREAADLKKNVPNAEVQRVGEGILVKFDSGILFDLNQSVLKPAAQQNLAKFSQNLLSNPDTKIQIDGYTDNSGSAAYNLNLSEQRARSVKSYLMSSGVDASRMVTVGYGDTHPAADNGNEAGRAKNRRVEIGIMASGAMQKSAQQGTMN